MNASPVSAPLHASNVLARLPQSAQGIKALRMQRMMSPSRFNANTKTPVPSSKPGSQRNLGDSSATSGQTSLRGKFELSARCEYIGSTAKESTVIPPPTHTVSKPALAVNVAPNAGQRKGSIPRWPGGAVRFGVG